MSRESLEQYRQALREGQRFAKAAESAGRSPCLPTLDQLIQPEAALQKCDLGLVQIPMDMIVGSESAGRSASLAGNFMPLMEEGSEFAQKWRAVCDAHLSDEGLRDPIQCDEYLGQFYVREGHKRVSVLRSFHAPTVPGLVTRLLPPPDDTPERRLYSEFLDFYRLSGQYGLALRSPGSFRRLQAALGMEPDHEWTEAEKRSFRAGYWRFREAWDRVRPHDLDVTAAEALLSWLEIQPFSALKEEMNLDRALEPLAADLRARSAPDPIAVSTGPAEKSRGLVSRIWSAARVSPLTAGFFYGFSPETSPWTAAHEQGRLYLAEKLGGRVETKAYLAPGGDWYAAMKRAVEQDRLQAVFATIPPMMDDCRKLAAEFPGVKVLACDLSQPHPSVRAYYSRMYECKFIAGAVAGAMAEGPLLGYIADYPIFGALAGVNAFALGAQWTRPGVRVRLAWSCQTEKPLAALQSAGIRVICGRAGAPGSADQPPEYGLFRLGEGDSAQPLALPCWQWGVMYEKLVRAMLDGSWEAGGGKAVNYWWGLGSGAVDVQWSDSLPSGVRRLAELLKGSVAHGTLLPFQTAVRDQSGALRCDETSALTPEDIMRMDWLCDAVEGDIPSFDQLLPRAQRLVRLLGVYRDEIAPEKAEKQL